MATFETKPNSKVLTALVVVGVVIVISIAVVLVHQLQFSAKSSLSSSTQTTSVNSHIVYVIMPNGVGNNPSLNYQPATITVVIGVNNTIEWIDQDPAAPHTVTFTSVPTGVDAKAISSGNLVQGDTFTVNLTVPGTYEYYCIYHSWMKGTIIVKS
jgi:plastocyanin